MTTTIIKPVISEQIIPKKRKTTNKASVFLTTNQFVSNCIMVTLCREGKISLAGFLGAIVSTIITAILTIAYLPSDLSPFVSVTACIAGPIVIYLISNVIIYFVISELDFAVSSRPF